MRRKFKCANNGCPRNVFTEQTPGILRYAWRTNRLNKIIDAIALDTNTHQGKIITKLVSAAQSGENGQPFRWKAGTPV